MRLETGQNSKTSLRQTIRSKASAVFHKKKMRYRPGQVPHSVLRRSMLDPKPQPLKRQSTSIRQPVDKRWKRTLWEDVKVGDFVFLRNNDAVPADMVVLSSSEPDGLCYVETQNLDGETNLKIKHSLQATNEIRTPEDCEQSKFYIESEPPHANLYSYNGVLKWKVEDEMTEDKTPERRQSSFSTHTASEETAVELETIADYGDDDDDDIVSHEKTEAITGSSILLRGCVLRNTGWVIGLVLFTGNETKIMLNSGKTPSKRSKMEKQTNPYVKHLYFSCVFYNIFKCTNPNLFLLGHFQFCNTFSLVFNLLYCREYPV
jgi:phospholipid-translocating ATPase